jgi:hypothetical protein
VALVGGYAEMVRRLFEVAMFVELDGFGDVFIR